MIAVLTPFLAAFALSLALVPLCRLLAIRMGRMAHPREDRWHRRPVALLGGVAIGLSLFAGAGVFGLVGQMPVLLDLRAGRVSDRSHRRPHQPEAVDEAG